MKARVTVLFAILSPVLTFSLLGWIFSLHGTRGLLQVEYPFRIVLLSVAVLGLVPFALLALGRLAGSKRAARPRFRVSIPVVSLLAIVISLFGLAYLNGFPSYPVGNTTPRLIVAASTGSQGIPNLAVVAESAAAAQYTLTWGKASFQSVAKEEKASREHVFMLEGLEPATEYTYTLNGGPEYRFSTPATSRPLHFAIGSDAHFGAGDSRNDLTQHMLAQIADPANRFDYFFSLGDNVEFGFRTEQWQEARSGFAATVSTIPSSFIAGNHDAMFTGLRRYLDYGYPPGVELQNGTRLWHRFDFGNVHFIVLDVEWSAESFTTQQAAWLEAELMSIPMEDWTIVMAHGFCFGSGSVTRGWKSYDNPETIRKLTPLFEKYGVDLVLSGHAHQMELLQKSGVTYVIAGSFGGAPDRPRTYASPESLWYLAGSYGYVDVTVDGSTATLTFKNADGVELKSFVVERES